MKKIQFSKPFINFLLIGLSILTVSRFILFFIFKSRVTETPNYGLIFPIGLRMDLIALCYLLFLPVALIALVPDSFLKKIQGFLTVYFILFLTLILFLELSTLDFINEYDVRPNKLFIDYLIYPKEVVGTLLKSYLSSIFVTIIVLAGFVYALIRYRKPLFEIRETNYKTKLLVFPLIAFFVFFGARSSLTSKRPINASNAIFSTDHLTNSLGLNSFYTVTFALYSMKNEINPEKMYGKMDYAEAISRVKKYMDVKPADFTDDSIPLLHIQKADSIKKRPYNVVIILEESLGAEYVGSLGGLPLTPEFDKLTKEGTLFTNLFSTGTRSVRGIEAVVTGFLPSPSESVVKLNNSQKDFYTIASLLKQKGYDTSFIYGGMANFDNMGAFFSGNGFDKIIDEDDFDSKKSAFHGTWGWSDEDVMAKANNYFKSLGDKPFVSLVFSSSNHEPFEFPDGRIKFYDKQKNTVNNAMKYADYSIGQFFKQAQKEEYYKNTIFLVIADHNTRTYGKHLVPINKFHIPALIIGPNVPKDEKYKKLCSQIDIQPTLLGKIGMDIKTPMAGRNLFQLSGSIPGRAIMQFNDINAFRVENEVVIMQPNKKPQQFHVEKDTIFTPQKLDDNLAKDALAHVIVPYYLYNHRKYRLK
ncbi:LTA synthase family protein [Flavobacterium aquicola]|uniref:Phosphoglycerol transferase MdoB-like AlkP superfamily enzyme n=1 Tax=Flavobacterium aquicola TaxID=1682742 RepID=A0A3E0ERA5_9FLAO|nr:LTA synthase family protein [Flavobacterium aquicola]REH00775.1 phosphoglycerol transferase MdoB-like AlkP superfamily enzyme [Flavobacterium aquicola]